MKIDIKTLTDKYVEAGLIPDNFTQGWEEYAAWQLNCLKKMGMTQDSILLDIGCGPLRLGLEAMEFLKSGNYCGIDAFEPYYRLATWLAEMHGHKNDFQIIHSDKFEFKNFKKKFDFAMAQSVLTHLSQIQIDKCILELKQVMNPGGQFVFTYNNLDYSRGFLYYDHPMIAGGFCDIRFWENLGAKYNIKFITPEIKHPQQQVGIYLF